MAAVLHAALPTATAPSAHLNLRAPCVQPPPRTLRRLAGGGRKGGRHGGAPVLGVAAGVVAAVRLAGDGRRRAACRARSSVGGAHGKQRALGARRARTASAGDAETQAFFEWAASVGVEVSPSVAIEPAGGIDLRRVVAREALAVGDVLVRLPGDVAVSVDTDVNAAPPAEMAPLAEWWSRHTRSSVRIAAALAWERKRMQPYIAMLPILEDIHSPWRWDDAELAFLSENMATSARSRREALRSAWEDLEAAGLAARVPRELFLRAHHAAASRAFSGEVANASRIGSLAAAASAAALVAAAAAVAAGVVADLPTVAVVATGGAVACGAAAAASSSSVVMSLLPMVDQVNHRNGPPPDLQFDPLSGRWEMRALRKYSPGDEITISYGDKSNDNLLLQHGFVEEDNAVDTFELPPPSGAAGDGFRDRHGVGSLLRLSRGGGAAALRGDGVAVEALSGEDSEAVAAAVKEAVLRFAPEGDEEVRQKLATSEPALVRAELVVQWRRERRRLLAEASQRWGAAS